MNSDFLDALTWLQIWYADQCDSDWEHQYGVNIETLDNPGWHLRIAAVRNCPGGQAS